MFFFLASPGSWLSAGCPLGDPSADRQEASVLETVVREGKAGDVKSARDAQRAQRGGSGGSSCWRFFLKSYGFFYGSCFFFFFLGVWLILFSSMLMSFYMQQPTEHSS